MMSLLMTCEYRKKSVFPDVNSILYLSLSKHVGRHFQSSTTIWHSDPEVKQTQMSHDKDAANAKSYPTYWLVNNKSHKEQLHHPYTKKMYSFNCYNESSWINQFNHFMAQVHHGSGHLQSWTTETWSHDSSNQLPWMQSWPEMTKHALAARGSLWLAERKSNKYPKRLEVILWIGFKQNDTIIQLNHSEYSGLVNF